MNSLLLFIVALVLANVVIAQSDVLLVNKGENGLYLEHKVLAKEGLYAIGRLYSVNPKHLAAFNRMDMNKGLEIDQVLQIPLTDTNFTQKSTSGTPVYYRVTSGDGLIKISVDHNNVPMKSIREWNGFTGDNIQEGSNLIVGFLISKEMVAYLANIRARNAELAKQAALQQQEAEKNAAAVKEEDKAIVKEEIKEPPVTTKPEVKADVKTEAVTSSAPKDTPVEKKKEEPPKVIAAVVKEEIKTTPADFGYFKTSFDQQVKARPIARNATVTSGIFKTNSGMREAKYYLLMDGVSPGTIIKITNPDNNKAVYAKVLGEMSGIRQNQGLDIRISNAAASALQVTEDEKFVVRVNY
jgi:LysM repeat protein